jgi:hypothetical protein
LLVVELLIDSEAKIQKVALLQLWLSWLKPALKKMGFSFSEELSMTLDLKKDQNLEQPGQLMKILKRFLKRNLEKK